MRAQCPEWSVAMLSSSDAFKLRNAERAAKQSKAGLWRNYVPPASAGTRASDKFQGPSWRSSLATAWLCWTLHGCVLK